MEEEGVTILKIAQDSDFLSFEDKKENEIKGDPVTEFILTLHTKKASDFLNSFAGHYEGQITEKFGEDFPSAEEIRESAEEINKTMEEDGVKIKDDLISISYMVDEDDMEFRRIKFSFDFELEKKEEFDSFGGFINEIEEGSFSIALTYNKIGEQISVEAPEESESLKSVIMETMIKMKGMSETGEGLFSSLPGMDKDKTSKKETETEEDLTEVDGGCEYGEKAAGGIVAECNDQGEPTLIAMKEDIAEEAEWGCKGEKMGADSESDGEYNTQKIVENCQEEDIAARLCAESSEGGYKDWYLPSKEELNLLYNNKDKIGGFSDDYYWSSSEYSSNRAWCQYFHDGYQYDDHKDNSYRVRCLRDKK